MHHFSPNNHSYASSQYFSLCFDPYIYPHSISDLSYLALCFKYLNQTLGMSQKLTTSQSRFLATSSILESLFQLLLQIALIKTPYWSLSMKFIELRYLIKFFAYRKPNSIRTIAFFYLPNMPLKVCKSDPILDF